MHHDAPERWNGTWIHFREAGNVAHVTVERRKPLEVPVDPDITAELKAADIEARVEAAERSAELLERLRRL
jgi:hypothetical protein